MWSSFILNFIRQENSKTCAVLHRKEQLWRWARPARLRERCWTKAKPLPRHTQNTLVSQTQKVSLAYSSCQSPPENESTDQKNPAGLLRATTNLTRTFSTRTPAPLCTLRRRSEVRDVHPRPRRAACFLQLRFAVPVQIL